MEGGSYRKESNGDLTLVSRTVRVPPNTASEPEAVEPEVETEPEDDPE